MDKLIVTTVGIGLIGAIYWFFFGKKDEEIVAANNWKIIVEGGYKPSTIRIHKGKPSTLTFLRKDPNSCLEEIVIPDFKIKKFLPLNEKVEITLSPTKTETFKIHCGMNMFHGKIEVV